MTADRYVVCGLATVRSPWFKEVGRWSTSAAIPVDFVRCVSAEELRARLNSGRSFSAALVDAGVPGLDRDLIDAAVESGAAMIVVDDGRARRNWSSLGATRVLPTGFSREDLMEAMSRHATPFERVSERRPNSTAALPTADWSGKLVTVTGGHGAGTSTIAMALAQGLGDDPRFSGLTLLADLNLHADLALLHDARDIVPGLQELTDAHRTGSPSAADIRSMVFDASDRGYHLLLGLRRHRDWAVLRKQAVMASLASLLRCYRMVVADVEADFEGEDEVGSHDVEDRNLLARTSVLRADLVIAVGTPTVKGMHGLLRVLGDLVGSGVEPARVLPVLNRSARSARQRSEAAGAFGTLAAPISTAFPSPLHLPERRQLDDTVRGDRRLPNQLSRPLADAVNAIVADSDRSQAAATPAPLAVVPGSLGHLTASLEAHADHEAGDDFGGTDFPESEAG